MTAKPDVVIEYCPRCGWLLRSSWLAQEVLTSFSEDLARVSLMPSGESGRFQIRLSSVLIWCRKRDVGFPQAAELKRRLRDHIAPGRSLGHVDSDS